jgi:hypothetical protein
VRITYGELKRLVAATLPKESVSAAVKPPVPGGLLSTAVSNRRQSGHDHRRDAGGELRGRLAGVPLAGAASGAISVEPKDARIVVTDDHLCLITDQTGAQT